MKKQKENRKGKVQIMVTIRNLQKSYGKFHVLDGLNMTVPDGEVYGFLGKNGCGKTTTMNILCNVIPKDGGDVILGDENNGDGKRIKIGYLPETPSLFNYMNGYEYLKYIAACCQYEGNVNSRIDEVMEIIGMREGGKRVIKGYSRGMNQRMGIGAIIFDHPQVLVLDEPTSALDPEGRADVMNIIRSLAQTGCTIILCTHILSDVEKAAGSIGILKNGKMVIEGKIGDVLMNHAKPEIEVKLFAANERSVALIKDLEQHPLIDKVDFYQNTGYFVVRTNRLEEAAGLLMKTFGENSVVPSEMKAVTESLEDIYLKVVNENA